MKEMEKAKLQKPEEAKKPATTYILQPVKAELEADPKKIGAVVKHWFKKMKCF